MLNGREVGMSLSGFKKLKTRLRHLKKRLDRKALRDPRTVRDYALRNKWERVRFILIKRYGDEI